ncbi:nickel pincer cofactor biosynthesis protein LarB [Staphylococcus gallinarum]|uniref:Nickel pincer cofactor biosynthesis protein LarB n=1 Tax=Staphylococcus gallinarum TaxID=1293 RepID=A0A3A0VTL4_STAGA|nr:nickel pincer cofactor biosynthesis protein LarB [Staphylococcus gallinarum]RIP37056.1 nickel pincer cofactor biosynthesis protein LarB [Staphylococcus gallinarum]
MTENEKTIEALLTAVQSNTLSVESAVEQLEHYKDIGFAKVDLHRKQRQGFPEVIYGEGKSAHQIANIIQALLSNSERVLVTRIDQDKANYVLTQYPQLEYHETAKILSTPIDSIPKSRYKAAIICAGTSDLPIAEEAALTAQVMGTEVERFYDVGVSGIHRLFDHIETIRKCKVSVVAAGMEGALSSVISGLVAHPIYAVPTSIGYGANLNGVTTLLAMINSCAPGTSVLNIDNGFGGGYNAAMLIHMLEQEQQTEESL